MHSAIYQGQIRHRRFTPQYREFTYQIFMVYLDLHELDQVFSQSPWWSHKRFSLAWFRRRDFFDGQSGSLYDAVADRVQQQTGERPSGPIRMLTNLRYFGFIINPITCYYCFDREGKNVETIVAEVTNTPWKQRCHYILKPGENGFAEAKNQQHCQFDKVMHVSPFQPMHLVYKWYSKTPGNHLLMHIDMQDNITSKKVFDATLSLLRQPMTKSTMRHFIWRYPWMTVKVAAAIYWQAMKLFLCKNRYFSNSHVAQKWITSFNSKECNTASGTEGK
ncbi:MAG: DUF1365 domain-containing protein [Cellvibrionaceae bacterium]|nr:DUF1365 domain-containing protein [Cellvibrionaceae bacterium]